MGLKSMLGREALPVVSHGEGKKVILDVRIANARARADKAAALEVIGSPVPVAPHQPTRPDGALADETLPRIQRNGLGAGHLEVELQVVLQVLADAGQVMPSLDPERLQFVRRTNPGQLQEV